MPETAYRATHVLVEPGRLLRNAAVHVSSAGRFTRVESSHNGSSETGTKVVDWGSAIIMPGLINAHAHLELTSFHNQLTRFDSFTGWISQLVSRRRLWTPDDFVSSTREGARLSLAAGTTLVGDIASSAMGWKATFGQNLRRVVFEELLALSPDQADPVLRQLKQRLKESEPNPLLIHGISPHAPYTVSPDLYMRAAEEARRHSMPLATHLAETRAELELLSSGTGEFIEFLRASGVLPQRWNPPKSAPAHYLEGLGVLGPSCILIHCNYLDQPSIDRINQSRSHVVYCPRSHAFFGHALHPIRNLLDEGVNVALGTDSLASNSSLSIMDEMRFLFEKRKDIGAEEIFTAATLGGAKALGLDGRLGRLQKDYWADMTVFRLPANIKTGRLLEQILEGAGECAATVVRGEIAWEKTA